MAMILMMVDLYLSVLKLYQMRDIRDLKFLNFKTDNITWQSDVFCFFFLVSHSSCYILS